MERYDIAIIGTGPAGLEAALTANARNKSILLIGSRDLSVKVSKAHGILNYLGLPKVSGEAMAKVFKEQIADAGIEITEGKVMYAYPMGDYFALQADYTDEIPEARTVILATGLAQTKGLPGEDRFLGSGVSYCATCDARFYSGKKAIVVGYSPKEEEEADFLSRCFCSGFSCETVPGVKPVGDRNRFLTRCEPIFIIPTTSPTIGMECNTAFINVFAGIFCQIIDVAISTPDEFAVF